MFKKIISEIAGKFLYSYLLDLIIDLLIDRIAKYKDDIDFDKVETDAIKLIREKVNFYFLEDVLIALLKIVLKNCSAIFEGILESQKIWNALREKNFKKAAKLLKKLILEKIKAGV